MKRFEFEHHCAPYTDYMPVRDNDPIRRITFVDNGTPYITYAETFNTTEITKLEADTLLEAEIEDNA